MLKSSSFILLLILLQACTINGSNSADSKQQFTHSRLHKIMTDRISVSLDQIDTLMTDHNRTEVDLDQDRRYQASRIADSAAELQRTVDMILKIQPTLDLTEHQVPVFIKLANQLKAQGGELEQLARNNQIDALKPALKRTKNTCMTCHSLFRGY